MGWDKQAVGGAAAANVNVISSVPIDVSDRVGRLLGHIQIDGQPISVDVTDRIGRLLGVVDSITNPIVVSSVTNAIRSILQDEDGHAIASSLRNTAYQLQVDPGVFDAYDVIELLERIADAVEANVEGG